MEATETGRSAVGISLFRPALSHFEMIAGYYQARFYQECAELYREMLGSAGLGPNGMTIVSVLQACGQSKYNVRRISHSNHLGLSN
jgi:pentatricopeptide repeat protein